MWTCYQLRYRACSDICVGFHKLGVVQRTRYFLPPRNFWAAATALRAANKAVSGQTPDYVEAGRHVEANLRFSCFFVARADSPIFPWSGEADFEADFVGSRARVTIQSDTATALDGGLFDLEFIAARSSQGVPTEFTGYVWATGAYARDALTSFLKVFRIGGERRYGLGEIRLLGAPTECLAPFGFETSECGGAPTIAASKSTCIPAHVEAGSCCHYPGAIFSGELEPFTGRSTTSAGAGRIVETPVLCWAPGMKADQDLRFEIGSQGIWKCLDPVSKR